MAAILTTTRMLGLLMPRFDQAYVRAVQSAVQGQPFLRDSLARPDLSQCLANAFSGPTCGWIC
jgi:hypothetical protein